MVALEVRRAEGAGERRSDLGAFPPLARGTHHRSKKDGAGSSGGSEPPGCEAVAVSPAVSGGCSVEVRRGKSAGERDVALIWLVAA
jgi:hypothetical protein